MVPLSKKIVMRYLPNTLGFRSVMLSPNLMTLGSRGRYQLFKELEQLKNSSSTESAASNKITTKYNKSCQMLQSLRKKKSTSDKL